MQLLLFIFLYPFLWLISILPFRVLYFFSDCVYVLVYYIIGYRKKTVRENLEIALPHLSKQERHVIEKKFYHHFCDSFFEMIKTMTISDSEIEKRFTFTNLEVYLDMEKRGKSIALFCAHYSSYEWLISMNRKINFKGYAIYKRIRNKYFDKLVRDIRARFQAHLIDTKETINVIHENQKNDIKGVYGFASDQSPKASKAFHWGEFFGINVPMHTGAEMIAKRMDLNVIFVKGEKIKRGYYQATFVEMVDNPKEVPNYQISDMFLRLVEQQILEAPEYYLWTHKRWKFRGQSQLHPTK
ncbi:lysophospholipid acyltransferase family protein [Flavobacterium sp. WW92]|uniref:lysophospholipid acyltransferase family protein n=1 Tax=unclassified Flavobacterium TaxID=196869 RepID=UPI0022253BB9|nr:MULTISPECIES: lysophospholipid acyltransferase family protein [unclassified Flavobacterium]WDO12429.1 lysophospholipid acyltransferase family protein [Flavobacterium sp. WW92]